MAKKLVQKKKSNVATELEYLRWFHSNADFGPASCDVRAILRNNFQAETGKELPKGYEEEA